ncbi:MAG: hypothetical protein Q8L57_01080, partial [bacterium]|nr:hypothetical protein [bacterium]
GSPKIDYVVALSPRFFEDLLKITGSVNLADAKKIVNAENFREILTGCSDAFGINSSQFVRIMSEFFPKFLQKLAELERTSSFKALDLINKNLEEKNVLIYAAEPSPQDYLKKAGWAGEVKKEKGNYLAVVDSVINSGLKTSFKKSIKHHSEIQPDGRIVNTLTLSYGYQSKLDSEPELANFVRIFVPEGSELLEAAIPEQEVYFPPLDYYIAGFRADNDVAEAEYNLITDVSGVQIFAESGKTVFGFWVLAPAGQNKTLTLKYRLPLRISPESDFYSFYIQKQPADYSDFESVLAFPKNLKPTGRSAENLQVFSGLVKLSGQLDKDKYYEVRFER